MLVKRTSYRALHYRTFSTVSTRFALAILVFASAVLPARLFAQETPHRKVLVRVTPEYPEMLKAAQIGGAVRLSATVQPNGTVTQVEVRGGNPILAERAQKAVMKWKYAPAPTQTVEEVGLSFSPH
jgi:TonB family protein